jgi:hypothetical protein
MQPKKTQAVQQFCQNRKRVENPKRYRPEVVNNRAKLVGFKEQTNMLCIVKTHQHSLIFAIV